MPKHAYSFAFLPQGVSRSPRLNIFLSGILLAVLVVGITGYVNSHAHQVYAAGGFDVGQGRQQATIYRDHYGVPNIYAHTMSGVWFGDGYAQAQDRLVQLELVRRNVEGTLSEIFGPGQLGQDQTIRTFFYAPAELNAQFNSLPSAFRQDIQDYADGINAYLARAYATPQNEQAMVPYEFWALGQLLGLSGPYRPANWSGIDTVAIGNFLAREFGGGGGSELDNFAFLQYLQAELTKKGDANAARDAFAIFNDARWINDKTAPTTVPSGNDGGEQSSAGVPAYLAALSARDVQTAARAWNGSRASIKRAGETLKVPWRDGSNAFVVAPSLSKDGHALLWGAPQEGFGSPSIDGEVYLHGPGYDAGGMYITGEPFILIGLNRNIAWTTTSEELVDQQIYVEQVNFNVNPPTYLFNGKQVPMQVIHEIINVAGQGPQSFVVYRTLHGPVFSIDQAHGLAFSMRFASFNKETGTLLGFAEMGGDANLNQYRQSVSKIVTLHNFFYADRQGNIAYFGAGLVPTLPKCAACDPRLPHLGDGSQEWQGFAPFDQMPHSINPAQGFLVNWNTKPDKAHFYQQNSNDEYWGTIFRSDRIAQIIQADGKLNLNDVLGVEHDIGTIDGDDVMRPAAPYFIPFLNQAYNQLKQAHDSLVDPATHPGLAPALKALNAWDEHTSLAQPAMSIFVEFMEALRLNMFGGGLNSAEQYIGAVNFNDNSLNAGTFLGNATYNLEYHILAGTHGLVPCNMLCYTQDYFNGNRNQILVESLNDAITLLSGTGPILGNGNSTGFGTTNIAAWGWIPYPDINWDSLDPLAAGVTTHFGISPSQERSTYMQAIDLAPRIYGMNVLPPGQSGFISVAGVPDPHFGDQVGLFNNFEYKPIDFDFKG
jgi:penicillin G amidase